MGRSPAGGASGGFDLRRARRRVQEIKHHEPAKLVIRIDGIERAEHDLALPNNRFALKLAADEKVHLVEIVSEQGVRLLSFFVLDLDPGEPLELQRELQMSGGRTVSATVRYGETWPSIEVSYRDLESTLPVSAANQTVAVRGSIRPSVLYGAWWQARSWITSLFDFLASKMNPMLATAAILGIASLVFLALWWTNVPRISANALLDRAETAEKSVATKQPSGVIYQKVAIRARHRSLERAIYRDPQGLRHPRRQQLSREDEQLKDKLTSAGISWDAPLSVSDYEKWRSSSGGTHDEVWRAGVHLWTLATTPVAQGQVLKETLTVRDTDFHVVDRTVELRDTGTIEVAELNYDVLPWGAVNPDWFEPLPGNTAIPSRAYPSLTPHLPYVPSAAELDEAELAARLVLNQLHADRGEQIAIARNGTGIVVRGLVDTEERKKAIETRLIRVPLVTPFVFTFDEMARKQVPDMDETTSIKAASVVRQPSPLELYLVPHGKSREEIWSLTQELLQAALSANRDSKETGDLFEHFVSHPDLTANARTDLNALVHSHKDAIEASLNHEEQLLRAAGFAPSGSSDDGNSSLALAALPTSAAKNLALCRELVSTNGEDARPVNAVVQELFANIAQLRGLSRLIPLAPDLLNAATERPATSKNQ